MTPGELLEYCLAKPGAWWDEPWEGDVVTKVDQKIFAFIGDHAVGLKCGADRDEADEWLARYPDDASVMAYIIWVDAPWWYFLPPGPWILVRKPVLAHTLQRR